jgi:alpha-N-arabinofuranosidase
VETNELGTHEFIWLCRELGAEPYLAGNVGSGTPQEMADWLHYCNSEMDTDLVALRKTNGHEKPMNVRYWGVGNENWGCGGHYDPEGYGKEYRRFATFMKQAEEKAELVACGLADRQWNLKLVETLRNHPFLVDHLSVHRYYSEGKAVDYSDQEYWEIMKGAVEVDNDIQYSSEILNFFFAGRKKVGVAMDEWGVWHPEATSDKNYEAPSTLRDAVAAAAVLDVFHKRCDVTSMANLAQIVNVLQCLVQTDGGKMWRTPTYHVFSMYAPHQGAKALRIDLETDEVELKDKTKIGVVSASASIKDGKLIVSAGNRHPSEAVRLKIDLRGSRAGEGTIETLSADMPRATNSASDPDRVTVLKDKAAGGSTIEVDLLPCSVQTMVWPIS